MRNRPDRKVIKIVFKSVVNFQPHFKYSNFSIGMQLYKDGKESIVRFIPHCKIRFGNDNCLSLLHIFDDDMSQWTVFKSCRKLCFN